MGNFFLMCEKMPEIVVFRRVVLWSEHKRCHVCCRLALQVLSPETGGGHLQY